MEVKIIFSINDTEAIGQPYVKRINISHMQKLTQNGSYIKMWRKTENLYDLGFSREFLKRPQNLQTKKIFNQ